MSTQRDRGSVTAELALGMVALTLLFGALSGLVGASATQLRISGAAGAAARELARGTDPAATERLVHRLSGPTPSAVRITPEGDVTAVTVQQVYRLPLPGSPTLTLTGRAAAVREQP